MGFLSIFSFLGPRDSDRWGVAFDLDRCLRWSRAGLKAWLTLLIGRHSIDPPNP